MVSKAMARQLKMATGLALCLFLPAGPANAGLQQAMAILITFGAYEQSDLPRAFVAAGDGNDAPLNISFGPELRYDPVSGNLTANLSAAIVETGDPGWEYAKLYNVSIATFASDLSFGGAVSPQRMDFYWNGLLFNGGPLIGVSVGDGYSSFDGTHFSYPYTTGFGVGSYVATILNFGDVLSKNLSLLQVEQTLGLRDSTAGLVDYRGAAHDSLLQATLRLTIVPEPTTFIEGMIGIAILGGAHSAHIRRHLLRNDRLS
jgi:hypothetical protein